MSRRSEQLKAVSEGFLQVHREWVNAPNKPTPDQKYWDTVDSVVEAFDEGDDNDIPGDCRELAKAAESLRVERDEFDNRTDVGNLYPADPFWLAVEAFETAMLAFDRKSQPLPALESIASLKQLRNITDTQIAKIWGLKDRFGNLSVQMVQQELDKPGSITQTPGAMDGRDWIDPRLARKNKGQASKSRQVEALAEKSKAARKPVKPIPESPKDLWEQKVSVAQAAKMLGKSAEEVENLFKLFEEERDEALKSGAILSAQTQAIRELAAKGKGPSAIAKEMKLDPKLVAAAIA